MVLGDEPGYPLLSWSVPYAEEHLPLEFLTSASRGQRCGGSFFSPFCPGTGEDCAFCGSCWQTDFSLFPLNAWLAILHINNKTKFLLKWFYFVHDHSSICWDLFPFLGERKWQQIKSREAGLFSRPWPIWTEGTPPIRWHCLREEDSSMPSGVR